MNNYANIAVQAARIGATGVPPMQAWKTVAAQVYLDSNNDKKVKSCPMYAFLGLAERGEIVGIPPGQYGKPRTGSNKRYAAEALNLIRNDNSLSSRPKDLWRQIQQIEQRVIRYITNRCTW